MSSSTILLITDSFPCANGAGISQTLYNLFDEFPDKINVIIYNDEIIPSLDVRLHVDWIVIPNGPYKNLSNRLGRYVNRSLEWCQLTWQGRQNWINFPSHQFATVLVSTSIPQKLQFAWCLLRRGYSVIPFFMDDWLAGSPSKWKGGSLQQVAKEILQAAPCWLMISRQLDKTLRQRYGLGKKPTLVIHNPSPAVEQFSSVDHQNGDIQLGGVLSTGNRRQIIYAGSIWPMHADALIATAKAIHFLHCKRNIEYQLIIHTTDVQWKKYRQQLEGPGVYYKGWKPYNEIHAYLRDAWLLLCTASFDKLYKAYSDSSVQTKLTDYMAVGRPVLFVGPADAASGIFVEEYDIGFTIETDKSMDIAARLEAIGRMKANWQRRADNCLLFAVNQFSKTVVQSRLYDFLKQYLKPVSNNFSEESE